MAWHCKNKRWDFIAMPTWFFQEISERFASTFDLSTLGGIFDVWFLSCYVDFSLRDLEDFTLLSLVFPCFLFSKRGFIVTSNIGRKMIFFTPYFSGFKKKQPIHYIACHPIPEPKLKIPQRLMYVNLMASSNWRPFFRGYIYIPTFSRHYKQ